MLITNFALHILIPLVAGFAVSLYLQRASLNLLGDLCMTAQRADFWVRILNVLYLGVPLLFSMLFSPQLDLADTAYVAQRSMMATLLGLVSSVLVVAFRVMRSVPQVATEQRNAKPAPAWQAQHD